MPWKTPKHLLKWEDKVKEIREIDTRFYQTVLSALLSIRNMETKSIQSVVDLEWYINILKDIDKDLIDKINYEEKI